MYMYSTWYFLNIYSDYTKLNTLYSKWKKNPNKCNLINNTMRPMILELVISHFPQEVADKELTSLLGRGARHYSWVLLLVSAAVTVMTISFLATTLNCDDHGGHDANHICCLRSSQTKMTLPLSSVLWSSRWHVQPRDNFGRGWCHSPWDFCQKIWECWPVEISEREWDVWRVTWDDILVREIELIV